MTEISRPLRLAESVGALSLATDLAMGQPLEHGLRTAVLAVRMAQAMGLPEGIRRRRARAANPSLRAELATGHEKLLARNQALDRISANSALGSSPDCRSRNLVLTSRLTGTRRRWLGTEAYRPRQIRHIRYLLRQYRRGACIQHAWVRL
jgi:hypothetical protein